MIQILALREFFSEKQSKNVKAEVWFEKGMRAPAVEDIFANPLQFIKDKTAPSERFNLYYTIAECLEEKGRKLLIQHHIPFDIDKIEVPETKGKPDLTALTLIARIACEAIGVPFEKCGVLFSGNGIQIIVGTTHPIENVDYFDQVRPHFKAICDRITLKLQQAGIKGEADHSVWSPARLMRYPETENVKPDKPVRKSKILNATIERTNFKLTVASGLPDVPTNEQISTSIADAFPTPDVKTILDPDKGCKFLYWAQTQPEKVSESEWYAQLSIVARFPDGRKHAHKMSEGHPGYSFEETEQKISQALDASGPRTCKNINGVSGGKCKGCKWENTKLGSPILIEGEDHVKTAKQGFYNFFMNPETGKITKGKPDFEGLQKWFRREYKYKSVLGTDVIYTWNGTHYEDMPKDLILKYAQEKFDPKPNTQMRHEFFQYVRLNDMIKIDWFTESIQGKMNFKNGVFDIKAGILSAHSMDNGFRTVLPCDYDPHAKAPRFEQFIDEVTMGRESLAKILQEYLGYIFANEDCKYQKVLVMLGEGSNGKSKFIELVRALATKQGFSSLSVKDMNSDQNRYLMEGKIVNIAEENSKDAFRDTELIKNFASGGEIRVKKLYVQPYEYQNKTKLIMSCNKAPNSADDSYGFYRRLLFIPFNQDFTEDKGNLDPNLLDKLLAELPGIFNWIMQGYLRLNKQNRFTDSAESNAVMLKYKADTNSIEAWCNDSIEYNPDGSIEVNRQEIYNDYLAYCEMGKLPIQPANRVYDHLRSLIKRKGGVLQEYKRKKDNIRYWTINHLKCLSVITK